jgi:hypothetical protein
MREIGEQAAVLLCLSESESQCNNLQIMAMGCKHQVTMICSTAYRLSVYTVCYFIEYLFKAQSMTETLATNISTYVDIQGDSGCR